MKISRQILTLLFLFLPGLSFSDQVPENLLNQLSKFLEEHNDNYAEKGFRSEYSIGNIDPRLNTRNCDNPISFELNKQPEKQNNITILASCQDKKPWKFYVSVNFTLFGKVIVASGSIRRGDKITASQLETKEEIINRNRYISYSKPDEVIGMIAKRSIRNGSIIQASHIQPPKLVKRGDNVVIVATNSAISVRMMGTAMMDGSLGQQISIKNKQSERVVKGRVTEAGIVTISL